MRIHRSKFVEKLAVLYQFAATDDDARALMLQAQRDEEEYSAFARQFVI
jgi:hypothetical protein